MRFRHSKLAVACILATTIVPTTLARAISFGSKDEASIKVEKGDTFKGVSTLAIGSFRVAFVTEDSAISTSHGAFSNGGSSAKMTGELTGIDHTLMQKIADEVYADFLKQAAAKGYTILDSAKVAAASPSYSAVTQTVNFSENRLGTVVIPTGQRSAPLAADDSAKESHGSATFGSAFGNLGKSTAKSDANKAFPLAAKDVNAPVLGVTIVVNFANFKGTSSSFGSSKATVEPGATIDGTNKNDLALFTSILAWNAKSCEYVGCMARVILQGEIHSDAPLGEVSKTKSGGWLSSAKGAATIDANPALYEQHVLEVTTQATTMLLDSVAKEK